ALAAHAARPTVVEINLFRLINELPAPLGAPLLGVMQLGALAAVPVLAVVALVLRRHRLAVLIILSGATAWAAAKLIQYLVDEDPPQLRLSKVVLHGSTQPGTAFPASHVAIAAALATVATPYVGRSARRFLWLLVAVIGIARIYVGLHLPIDVIGGLALGWMVGSAINFAVGVPARSLTNDQLLTLLRTMGLFPRSVEPLLADGHLHKCGTDGGEAYLVKSIDCNQPEQDWLYRIWRLVAFRELHGPSLPGSPEHRADHEAHLALLAERQGVRTPAIVATRHLGSQAALVVRRWIDATPVADIDDSLLSDAVLTDAWSQLDALHVAGILHRNLRPDDVLIDAMGHVWLIGFGSSEAGTDLDEQSADLAEMAVVLALRVGAERSIRTASAAIGPDRVVAALAHLQPLTLPAPLRRLLAEQPELLPSLRNAVAAIDGREVSEPVSPTRVAVTNLFPFAALAVAVYVLLPRLAETSTGLSELTAGRLPWLAAAAGAAATTYLMGAISLIAASGRPLALGRTYAVQLAAACTNRVLPAGLGAAATNIRYLELAGLDRANAGAAIALTAATGVGVHTALTAATLAAVGSSGPALHVPSIDPDWPVIVVVTAVAAAIGWVVWARKLHRPLVKLARTSSQAMLRAVRNPRLVAVLLLAAVGLSGAYILALAATLRAFG
ncbi:MAG TPA: phosphatase PAP2 family protein, partial [Candidatus Dormibacteraeota bacterium]|nr:phosphatase PAP2 family protein [Candidatus Dormibacteraeota bacterium]